MDLVLPGMDGTATTALIKKAHPEVSVVVVTSFGEARRVHGALEAGATGYVLKDADVDEIVRAIRAAHRGEVHLDATARAADALADRPAPRSRRADGPRA